MEFEEKSSIPQPFGCCYLLRSTSAADSCSQNEPSYFEIFKIEPKLAVNVYVLESDFLSFFCQKKICLPVNAALTFADEPDCQSLLATRRGERSECYRSCFCDENLRNFWKIQIAPFSRLEKKDVNVPRISLENIVRADEKTVSDTSPQPISAQS